MEKCYYCDTELEKDDVALCKKLLGKKIKQYFCREHLAEVLNTDVETYPIFKPGGVGHRFKAQSIVVY